MGSCGDSYAREVGSVGAGTEKSSRLGGSGGEKTYCSSSLEVYY